MDALVTAARTERGRSGLRLSEKAIRQYVNALPWETLHWNIARGNAVRTTKMVLQIKNGMECVVE